MDSNGTRQTGGRGRILAARTLLTLFVAWGSVLVMTRPAISMTHICLDPDKLAAVSPGVIYTIARVKITERGWPMEWSFKTDLVDELSPMKSGIDPGPLLCDIIVLGILVVAAWSLPRAGQFGLGLADVFTIAISVALTVSFHMLAWYRHLDVSQFAVDVGVFCVAMIILRTVRHFAGRLSSRRGPHPS
jgi:hypothetical protein